MDEQTQEFARSVGLPPTGDPEKWTREDLLRLRNMLNDHIEEHKKFMEKVKNSKLSNLIEEK